MTPHALGIDNLRRVVDAADDHPRFCSQALRIRDEGSNLVSMILRPGQLKLHAAIRKQREQNKPVRIVVLKTRRSNFTAGSCSEIFADITKWAGRKATIIADNYRPAGLEAFGYLKDFNNYFQTFEIPGVGGIRLPKLESDSENKLVYENGSMVEVLTAERGEIRGGGRHCLLCDELGFWRDPKLTMAGALNMVPRLPGTMVIAQSTANGIGNYFYELVQVARDPANESGWEFVFFGWLEHPLNLIPLSGDEKARLLNSLDREEKTLMALHGATLDQLAWRRWKIRTDLGGDIDLFHQEYPTTAEGAFIASGRPALDHKAVARMPVQEPINGELQVVEEFPRMKIGFQQAEFGRLSIWKHPQPGHRYCMSSDPSHGVDADDKKRGKNPDFAVHYVGDVDTGEQVALFRERLRPGPFAEYGAVLARYYNFAYWIPEANDPGFVDAIIRNYPPELVYNRRRDPTDRRAVQPQELGFETTEETRRWLVGAIDEAVRDGSIIIHSHVMVQECYTFVYKPTGKAEHQVGCHDDTVLAGALWCIGRRHYPRALKRLNEAVGGQPDTRRRSYGNRRKRDDDDD